MKKWVFLPLSIAVALLSACQTTQVSQCQWATGTPRYITNLPPTGISTPTPGSIPTPVTLEIDEKTITVDQVIEGQLCNDTWSGTVYVTCDVQVFGWEEQPTFLKDCDLEIEPGTVVYVAYHNDTAYYNGCSCHTGELTEP